MLPSPVWASSSAPKSEGRYSDTVPSPVVISQSSAIAAPGCDAVDDRAVPRVQAHTAELAGHVDAAVARLERETTLGAVNRHRSITGRQA